MSLTFTGSNEADPDGVFAHYHTVDVLVDVTAATDERHSGTHRRHEGVRRDHRWRAHPGQVASDRVWMGQWTVWWASSKAVGDGDHGEVARRRHRRGDIWCSRVIHVVTGHMRWIRSRCADGNSFRRGGGLTSSPDSAVGAFHSSLPKLAAIVDGLALLTIATANRAPEPRDRTRSAPPPGPLRTASTCRRRAPAR